MSADPRYERFVALVAESGRIWLLEDDAGLVGSVDGEGRRYLALWPDDASAAACAVGPWRDARPTSMHVGSVLPAIVERDGMLALHPTPEDEGLPVAAAELQERLGS